MFTRKILSIWISILLLTVFVAGCGSAKTSAPESSQGGAAANTATSANTTATSTTAAAEPAASSDAVTYPLTIKDDSGTEVTISKKPERIVSIIPSTTEVVFALGLGDQVVGVTDNDNYPEAVKTKEKVGGFELNIEKIASLKPDLIVGGAEITGKAVASLRKLGLTVVAVEPKSIQDVYQSIELIGKATDTVAKANEVVSGMKAQEEQVTKVLADLKPEDKPKVWVELDDTFYTVGKGSFIDQMVSEAGGINIAGNDEGYPQYSAEKVIQANPNVMLLNYNYVEKAVEKAKARASWKSVDAIKNNKVFELTPDLVSRPGPRITEGLLQIAKFLHPDKF